MRVSLPRLRVREPAGDPQIPIDDHDPLGLPAQTGGLVGQRVLPLRRAEVLPHLPRRGLPQVPDRPAPARTLPPPAAPCAPVPGARSSRQASNPLACTRFANRLTNPPARR